MLACVLLCVRWTVTLLYYVEGSWDYTIRVWDTRDGTCLDTVYDHGADVYGKTDTLTLITLLSLREPAHRD